MWRSSPRPSGNGAVAEALAQGVELFQGRPQLLRNLLSQDVRLGERVEVLEILVLDPEDIEACLVPGNQLLIGECPRGEAPSAAILG
jgi:hypothetical protein